MLTPMPGHVVNAIVSGITGLRVELPFAGPRAEGAWKDVLDVRQER
jgi:hypothetical protein